MKQPLDSSDVHQIVCESKALEQPRQLPLRRLRWCVLKCRLEMRAGLADITTVERSRRSNFGDRRKDTREYVANAVDFSLTTRSAGSRDDRLTGQPIMMAASSTKHESG
jgi:hypothetical protein